MNETWWVKPDDLDPDQKLIVELPLTGSHLIQGPPGSGKTNLLLLRANYLTLAGRPNVRILVFTRNLSEFIASGATEYSFSPNKVCSARQWQSEILRAYGSWPPLPPHFEDQRRVLLEATTRTVDDAGLGDLCDVLLLDESQDYWPDEIRLFRRLCKELYAVADLRQKIYEGDSPLDVLVESTEHQHTLRYHYRNGVKICTVADGIGSGDDSDPLLPTCNYDEEANPSSVTIIKLDDLSEHCTSLVHALTLQRKAFPDEMLGIIAPRHKDLDPIWQIIADSEHASVAVRQSAEEGYAPFTKNVRICVCTIHSAKGLEFRAVHLLAAEKIRVFATQRRLAFTAVTRAKTSLTIYHSAPLPGYLEDALTKVQPKPSLPTLEDLF